MKRGLELDEKEKANAEKKRTMQKLKFYMKRFIGQMRLPMYFKMSRYNFHDCLDAFVKLVFSVSHKRAWRAR